MKHLLAALILVATLSGCLVDTEPVTETKGEITLKCKITTKSGADSTVKCSERN